MVWLFREFRKLNIADRVVWSWRCWERNSQFNRSHRGVKNGLSSRREIVIERINCRIKAHSSVAPRVIARRSYTFSWLQLKINESNQITCVSIVIHFVSIKDLNSAAVTCKDWCIYTGQWTRFRTKCWTLYMLQKANKSQRRSGIFSRSESTIASTRDGDCFVFENRTVRSIPSSTNIWPI